MTACGNEPVSRIIGAGEGTVREHISVKVIAYRVAVKYCKSVVGIIYKTVIGCIGYVTCSVVAVAFV